MDKTLLNRTDLNLLPVIDAMIKTGSVTGAAQSLGRTQSAVSHALNRLRAHFDDPLFIRTPRGMEPTEFARRIYSELEPHLNDINTLLSQKPAFVPETSTVIFTLAMPEYVSFALMPRLTDNLARQAPHISLVTRPADRVKGLDLIENGDADILLGFFPDPPKHLGCVTLYKDHYVCAGHAGHPYFQAERPSRGIYLESRHVHVSLNPQIPRHQGMIDGKLHALGLRRDIRLTLNDYSLAAMLAASGDLITSEPRHILDKLALSFQLALRPLPFCSPEYTVNMVWPRKVDNDPAHLWLRDRIIESADI